MAKKNTTAAKAAATTNQVSRFAQIRQQKQAQTQKRKSAWTVVNEYFLMKEDYSAISSVKVFRERRTKDGEVLKARITYKQGCGDPEEYELRHHWEFQVGDELDKQTLSFCNLKDAKGKLKEYQGEVVYYLHGDVV